ncbi:aldehyde dehydrogenase-like protein [Mytilinidion resinicola]|uniref:aldehyde dehydrogenase (NAD(+)) n=1 Tax=Mytilinidion resinicola TaxID=574789 RepID=A0A6A6YJJ2_9PEZI|nr:aldehyde dehydrogenase-like protein [Mytilinidion resinicola]KAF2808125.1 aldehyde dehydrogenase-like protein [Mytilinidion resinicola]
MAPARTTEVDFTQFYNIVNGEKRSSKEFLHGFNPSTQQDLWDVPIASAKDIEDTIQAAKTAFKSWSKTTLQERSVLLKKYAAAIKPYLGDLGDLVMKEIGKPKGFAHHEAHYACAEAFEFFTNLTLEDEVVQGEDREYVLRYQPLGVVAAICPWNYPLGQATMKFLPGLMAGNTVIVKPSPFSPYSALKLVEIAQGILPPGVLSVLNGNDNLGPLLTTHPSIAKISFAGSVATGKKIAEAAAKTLKRVTLELGGNDATIVCKDVDIEKAAPQVILGAFFNTGQVCAGTKRIYIHEDIYPQFLEAIAKAARSFKVGASDAEGVTIGPVQNEMQYNKVKSIFEDSKTQGHKTIGNGAVIDKKGFFFEPTIVDQPPANSRIVTEEQFGPIVPSMPWSTEEEVIELANDSEMGLGASVWSNDLDQATRIAKQLDVGSVHINSMEKVSIKIPFGGHKESGIGVEGGPGAIKTYCDLQVLHYYKAGDAQVH